MLHARLGRGQARRPLLAVLCAAALALLAPHPAQAADGADVDTAASLARGGEHEAAAELYESLSKRRFRARDPRLTLLSAREYLAAGRYADAERMLALGGASLDGEDAVLAARTRAELALAQGRPDAALDALRAVPEPWPAPLAGELLDLRARAEFAAGRPLEGIRASEARARAIGTPEAGRESGQRILDALRADSAALSDSPDSATADELAWFELAALLADADTDPAAFSREAARWRSAHPGHPGAGFLPSPAAEAAGFGPALAAAGRADVVALLLPLSGRLEASGRAVRDGFIAAALAAPAGSRPRIEVYDTAALGAAAAYARALESGAAAVAGPLAKEEVAAVVAVQPPPVPTLALNSIALESPPAFLFQFALDPEQEARAVARRIARDGRVHGIVLVPRSAWGERVLAAFTEESRNAGLELTSVQYYEPGGQDYSGPLRAALGRFGGAGDSPARGPKPVRDGAAEARDGPQFAFIAASPGAARALVPQLRFQMAYAVPVYATSDALDPGARAAPDLEGVTLPEMPWILHAGLGAPQLWDALQANGSGGRARLRLYAFGYDAYALLRGLGSAAAGVGLGGLTGRLQLAPDGRVQRELDWAQVERGRPQVAGPALLPVVPGEP